MNPKWTLQAEVVISHPQLGQHGQHQPGITRTEQLDRGVRMTYSWNGDLPSPTTKPSLNFQRGNLLFTSTPPTDSGFHSDLTDPKCLTTCKIVLGDDGGGNGGSSICSRTQSLRCQRKCRSYCGDPWCYHSDTASRFSPVPESEEWPTMVRGPKMQDAQCQTVEMIDQATSPMFQIGGGRAGNGARKYVRHKTEPLLPKCSSECSDENKVKCGWGLFINYAKA